MGIASLSSNLVLLTTKAICENDGKETEISGGSRRDIIEYCIFEYAEEEEEEEEEKEEESLRKQWCCGSLLWEQRTSWG